MRQNSRKVAVVGVLFLSVFIGSAVYASNAKIVGLENEGCVGSRQERAIFNMRERLPVLNPIVISETLCSPADYRCDGGFVWLPYLINQERGWVLYTLPKKGNWMEVSIRNICTQRQVIRGDFLNEENSPYLEPGSAYALGWLRDQQQELYNGYENVAIRLYREVGEYKVGIYGLDDEKMQSRLLDSFTVSPL
ncbi:MAG: hypothetical protein R3A80_03070 [Bdellovibrionota bacterium]